MSDDTIVSFSRPAFKDQLSEVLQSGVQELIAAAVENELEIFLARYAGERDAQGVVRNGYQPECVFWSKLDTNSDSNWTLLPAETGQ